MEITFTCPQCGEVTLIGEEFVGQSGECRACGAVVTVPTVRADGHRGVRASTQSRTWGRFASYAMLVMVGVLLVGLCFKPVVSKTREASRRMSSKNNLKMLGLALHNYQSSYNQLPRAYWLTPNGERTLSWRVAISEFLSERMILEEHRADEAWDSTANRELAKRRRYLFDQPGAPNRPDGETGYMVITGPGTFFEEGKDISLNDCPDALSQTILVVEVKDSGVNWLQPVDLDIRNMHFKINAGGMGVSGPWTGGALALFADGEVRFLDEKMLESNLRAMMTRNGGERVSLPK